VRTLREFPVGDLKSLQEVSTKIAGAMHHIGSVLAPEAVERVF